MHSVIKRPAGILLSLAVMMVLALPTFAQYMTTVPSGTIIPLRMDSSLNSETSRVGDRFTATVFQEVVVNGRVVIPVGAKVEGHVTGVERAQRGSRAGTIAVAFDRLVYVNGGSVPVDGTLTTLNAAQRRELEGLDDEDRVGGTDRTRRAVVFIGGGAGAGAIIGAITGGGKGAAVGAGIGAILGTIGVLATKGDDAEVRPGTEFGMMVERSFTVDSARLGVASDRDYREYRDYDSTQVDSTQTVYTSYDSIRFAQMSLRDRGYYNGPINGQMTMATRNAIRAFQRDRNIAVTGELNFRTAQELGITDQSGLEGSPIEIFNARAERISTDSIRVSVDVETRGLGWQIFANQFINADTLHIYVRGVPPRGPSGTAIQRTPYAQTFTGMNNVRRVIFHGPQRDITIDLSGSGTVGGDINLGNARQISFLANRLLNSFQRDLNVRTARGQVIFDSRRDLSQREVDLLLQLHSLKASADVYSQLSANTSDLDVLRGAADSLIRQLRITNRLMNRGAGLTVSTIVRNDWEQLRTEIRSITGIDTDLDRDFDR